MQRNKQCSWNKHRTLSYPIAEAVLKLCDVDMTYSFTADGDAGAVAARRKTRFSTLDPVRAVERRVIRSQPRASMDDHGRG